MGKMWSPCLCATPSQDLYGECLLYCKASWEHYLHRCGVCGRYVMYGYSYHGAVYGSHCWIPVPDDKAELLLRFKEDRRSLKEALLDWEADLTGLVRWRPVLESSCDKYFEEAPVE